MIACSRQGESERLSAEPGVGANPGSRVQPGVSWSLVRAARAVLFLALLLGVSCGERSSSHSPFYQAFDANAEQKRVAARFGTVRGSGMQLNLLTSAPDGYCESFIVTGTLQPGEAEGLVSRLKEDALARLRRTGASLVGDPVDFLAQRPPEELDSLIQDHAKARTLLGATLRYRQGRFSGILDIAAAAFPKGEEEVWSVACRILEQSP
jgi:hypothetical protein